MWQRRRKSVTDSIMQMRDEDMEAALKQTETDGQCDDGWKLQWSGPNEVVATNADGSEQWTWYYPA